MLNLVPFFLAISASFSASSAWNGSLTRRWPRLRGDLDVRLGRTLAEAFTPNYESANF